MFSYLKEVSTKILLFRESKSFRQCFVKLFAIVFAESKNQYFLFNTSTYSFSPGREYG
jgi:hypothetical protein